MRDSFGGYCKGGESPRIARWVPNSIYNARRVGLGKYVRLPPTLLAECVYVGEPIRF